MEKVVAMSLYIHTALCVSRKSVSFTLLGGIPRAPYWGAQVQQSEHAGMSVG